jgi:TRAP-type mannitol/chloroaromatic compound transport system substrate-binding protein
VAGNLAEALASVFSSAAVAMVALITFRDELRARLRETWPTGVPLAAEAARTVRAYLETEQAAGRVPVTADTGAPLIGSGHLLFADRTGQPPTREAVAALVDGILRATLI